MTSSASELDINKEAVELYNAVHNSDEELLQKLITKGCCVNNGDECLTRPLHEACVQGHIGCVKLLLEGGAEVNVRNIDGATPICEAASYGHLKVVKLLLKHGALVNPPLLLTSPLHEAVIRDRSEIAEILIKAGANLNSSDCHFGTPLHVTAFSGGIECARVLVRAGAKVNAIKNHKTPLHDASMREDHSFISLLLDFGADIHARNSNGQRAVDLIAHNDSLAKQLLTEWESSVLTLMHLCRLQIRQTLGPARLCEINKLEVPKLLRNYIDYK